MKTFILAVLLLLVGTPAFAQQLAPTPHAAPRTPVNRETLAEHRAGMPPRDVSGSATVLDGDKLQIGDTDLRLFGIVPPQLSASFGPQARAALDAVLSGQTVNCHIRDRDHDGRLLATCVTAAGVDPAFDLLQRGLAVAARGSLADTEFVQTYTAAEQAAQNAKIGLWSVSMVTAPSVSAVSSEPPKPEPVAVKTSDVQVKTASSVMVPVKPAVAATVPVLVKTEVPVAAAVPVEAVGFFARYQILIAVVLMLVTAFSILGIVALYRRIERRDELKALAAALRGELLAARAVCLTRIKSIATDDDDRLSAWPRIRSTLYQAYVGKLGWLGAELARQIASIYGQSSDYASYYNSLGDDAATSTPKRQALQSLVTHIEEVLPRLAGIEQTGERLSPHVYMTAPQHHAAPSIPEAMPVVHRNAPPPVRETAAAKTVEASLSPVSVESAPSALMPEPDHSIEGKLRNAVRHIREKFVETTQTATSFDEPMTDYTALIEEDIERYAFGGDDEDNGHDFGKMSRH